MHVLAIILARAGSVRLPRKNLARLGGCSLVAHAAFAAMHARCVTNTVVSTDSQEIARECTVFGAAWINRPCDISGPHATIEQAVAHALPEAEKLYGKRFDLVVALHAAVPVRPRGAIDALVSSVVKHGACGGVTVVRRTPWIWRVGNGRAETWWNPPQYPRSQDVPGFTLEEINSIQVTPRELALKGERWRYPLVLQELPAWAGFDIDTGGDLEAARACWPGIETMLKQPCEMEAHLVKGAA